jgi:peptidoglycan/xylan/chitin deacetylase (PgdA/CDA1 family)
MPGDAWNKLEAAGFPEGGRTGAACVILLLMPGARTAPGQHNGKRANRSMQCGMKTGKMLAAAAALMLVLGAVAGCGGGASGPAGGPADGVRAGAGGAEVPAGGAREEAEGAGERAADPGLAGTEPSGLTPVPGEGGPPDPSAANPDEGAAPEPEPVAVTHYMNKNYFLKPVDDGGNERVVLLTFDDGPKEEEMLTDILDTLDRHGAKAIFFVNGFRVRQNPDLLRLIDERGHAVGNHSYDHIVLRGEPEDVVDRQLEDVQDLVEQTIGKRPRFFRPPNGAGSDYVRAKAAELGMLYMNWSNGSLDWADNRNDPEGVIRTVMEQLRPGCIILMHELSWTATALDDLLTRIEEEGYAFLHPDAIDPDVR